jgi:hypothetical protein
MDYNAYWWCWYSKSWQVAVAVMVDTAGGNYQGVWWLLVVLELL